MALVASAAATFTIAGCGGGGATEPQGSANADRSSTTVASTTTERVTTSTDQIPTEPANPDPTASTRIHPVRLTLNNDEGWTFDGSFDLPEPGVTFSKSIEKSPPGKARLVISFDSFEISQDRAGTPTFGNAGEVYPMALLPTDNGSRTGTPASVDGTFQLRFAGVSTGVGTDSCSVDLGDLICVIGPNVSGTQETSDDMAENDVDALITDLEGNRSTTWITVRYDSGVNFCGVQVGYTPSGIKLLDSSCLDTQLRSAGHTYN
jgi:hypothetical protein